MKTIFLFAVLCTCQFCFAGDNLIKGDPDALSRLAIMLEKLGGQAVWAEAKSVYTMEKARNPDYGDDMVSSSWDDLEAPGAVGDIKHPMFNVRYAWSSDGGWISRKGEHRDMIDDEVAEKNGFRVLDEAHQPLAEFYLTADNEVYRYVQLGGKAAHTYIYGPYKSFGLSRFPDWSTSIDGKWGAYHVQIMPSKKPFREQVSLKKPVLEWHGGAVKNNCDT